MSNVQLPGGVQPFSPSRSLTAGPAAAPPPQQLSLPPDALNTQTVPKDPAMLANLAIMSLDLASPDPAKVQAALLTLEGTFGPAYRQDVVSAIAGQIRPGMAPQNAQLLGQALVKAQATGALPQLQAAIAADPNLAAALGPVQTALGGQVTGAGPGNGVPSFLGAPPAQTATQPAATQPVAAAHVAAAPAAPVGISQAQAQEMARRLADHFESPTAAVEIARLPSDQAAAVMRIAFANPNLTSSLGRDQGVSLVAKAMAMRVPEPGAMEVMRGVLALPKAGNGGPMDEARSRAATALMHHGDPNKDIPGIMKLLIGQYPVSPDYAGALLKTLANRPAFVDHPTTVRTLAAMANDTMLFDVRLGAAFALSKSKLPWAKEALGTLSTLRDPAESSTRKFFILEYLKATEGKLSAQVKAVLEQLVKNSDKRVSDIAKELMRRT